MEFGGFRTFAAPTTFKFGRHPGLYFLAGGENKVDPSLGSNGVGKSTIWTVLCWILFGKTMEGLKAGDLKSWQAKQKGYYGTLWLGRHIIERMWKPNYLKFDGRVVTQLHLEEELGIDFDTFCMSVVLAQGQSMFFDLPAVKKLSLFTNLLGLDEWIGYSTKAKDMAYLLESKIHRIERNISKLEGKTDGLNIQDLKDKKATWRVLHETKVKDMLANVRILGKDADLLEERKTKAEAYKKMLKKQERKRVKEIDRLEKEYAEKRQEKYELTTDMTVLEMQKAEVEQNIKDAKLNRKGLCGRCGQTINEETLVMHVMGMKKNRYKLNAALETKEAAMVVIKRGLKLNNDYVRTARSDMEKVDTEQVRVDNDLIRIGSDYSKSFLAYKIEKELLKDERHEKNPFIPMLRERLEEEERLLDKISDKDKMRRKNSRQKDRTAFWVQGFKDVRLYLIEEALLQLEIETNKVLADLGFSSDWHIHYSIDKRTKTGSLVSGFDIDISSPHSKERVPFAAWSGGEKQRLRIAGSIGFSALMSARTGLDLGIEVYDEPTQHLSPQGIDSLLETLRLRALETRKCIWLVDHHTLDYGEFAGRAIVSKDEEGSVVWQS